MHLNIPVPKLIAGDIVWTQRRLLRSEQPEAHVLDWLPRTLHPGDTFFDIGAHYGWMSIVASRSVGASGRVVAFEASPVLLDILSYHKRVNRLQQLHIVPVAVSNTCEEDVPFFLINDGLSFRNSLTTGDDDAPYLTPSEKKICYVRSVSIDSFTRESGWNPSLIKIDVEGAELHVLEGAERLIASSRPALIVGVHPYWLPKAQTVAHIFDFLRRHRYVIADRHVIEFDGTYLADYLCIPHAG